MAFRNYSGQASTAGSVVYTGPASTTGIIIGVNLANVSGNNETVSLDIDGTHLIKDVPLSAGSALSALDGKLVVETGSVITATSSNDTAIDVIISVLEQ